MLSSRPMSDPKRPQENVIDVRDPRVAEAIQRYWRKNVRVMAACLLAWGV